MAHHRHELDVREAEIGDVRRELIGELGVGQRAVVLERVQPPRAEVDLVDRHRAPQRRAVLARGHVLAVGPLVRRAGHDRGRLRRDLGLERERVGLLLELAVLLADLELVVRAVHHAGDEELPDPRVAERAHRVQQALPVVEVAGDGDRARGRRPDGERRPDDAVDLAHVRAHLRPQLLVAALAEEVLVEVGQRRREAVGVLHGERIAARVRDLELVLKRQRRVLDRALEEPGRMHHRELDARGLDDDRLGHRAQRPHDDAAVGRRVRAEQRMGVVVLPADEPVDVGRDTHEMTSLCSIRAMPATGIDTQSGRLLSS